MADNKRPSYTQLMTGLGTLIYPVISGKPDTKYDPDGIWKTGLKLSAEHAQALVDKFDKALEAWRAEVVAQLNAKIKDAKNGQEKGKLQKELKDLKDSDRPIKPAYDDEGNETDEMVFNFKLPAQFTAKHGANAGKVIKMKPDLFDAKGKPIKGDVQVWGGTQAYIAAELRPFYTAKAGVGLSLRLKAVQIVKLVAGGSRDASGYGFGAVEGGYQAEEEAAETPFTDQSGDGEASGDDGNQDF